jgi:hypothetical protein
MFSFLAVVVTAVLLGLALLWRGVRALSRLAVRLVAIGRGRVRRREPDVARRRGAQ